MDFFFLRIYQPVIALRIRISFRFMPIFRRGQMKRQQKPQKQQRAPKKRRESIDKPMYLYKYYTLTAILKRIAPDSTANAIFLVWSSVGCMNPLCVCPASIRMCDWIDVRSVDWPHRNLLTCNLYRSSRNHLQRNMHDDCRRRTQSILANVTRRLNK